MLHKVALSLIPGITAEMVRYIDSKGLPLEEFFTLNMPDLAAILGINDFQMLQNSVRQEALFRARTEIEFINRHSIRVLFLLDEDYPVLLREIPDAPVVLYMLGDADLDASPCVSIVGTRKCTGYGMSFCSTFMEDLAPYFPNANIVSGLAYGIDSAAHKAALDNKISTVAVLAHGLDTIYPAANRDLARRIISHGGALVSEYPSGTRPFQKNFLQRNRIVAGLCEATIVVESEIRGGAMSTANHCFAYSRDLFAVPGRYSDSSSAGCNLLIAKEKARIFTSVADFMNVMNWVIPAIGAPAPQKSLFPELSGDSALVYETIKNFAAPITIDEIHSLTQLQLPVLMSLLTDLEFEGLISKIPGARYEIS